MRNSWKFQFSAPLFFAFQKSTSSRKRLPYSCDGLKGEGRGEQRDVEL